MVIRYVSPTHIPRGGSPHPFTSFCRWAVALGVVGLNGACTHGQEETVVQVRLASVGTNCTAQQNGTVSGNGNKNGHCSKAGSGASDGAGGTATGGTDGGDESGDDLSGGISLVDRNGNPIPFDPDNTQVEVETGLEDWQPALNVSLRPEARARLDVVLVADNSGGLSQDIDLLKSSLEDFADAFLLGAGENRVGLVRVSTDARPILELSSDPAAIGAAIDGLEVRNGWTALWDGVRIANQMLASNPLEGDDDETTCFSGAYPMIVTMTDGVDNNSAGQKNTRYPGDGIDTFLDDLSDLRAGSRRPTVHSVAIGRNIDETALRTLANDSGGVYRTVDSYDQLLGALRSTSAQLSSMIPVCFRPAHCGHDRVRINVTLDRDGETHRAEFVTALRPTCPQEG